MGQYYYVLAKEGKQRNEVFNRTLIENGQKNRTMGKLMEHSWFLNPFVNAICKKIYDAQESTRIIWMGDYADQLCGEPYRQQNGLSAETLYKYFSRCWLSDTGKSINSTNFTLKGKYLNNRTKKIFIDCDSYYQSSVMKTEDGDWCIHPLPLLTCIGNGLGGGDYTHPTLASTDHLLGTWAWDEITITDEPINDYEEIYPLFKEYGWE